MKRLFSALCAASVFSALLSAAVLSARIPSERRRNAEITVFCIFPYLLEEFKEDVGREIDRGIAFDGYHRLSVSAYARLKGREIVCLGEKKISRWLSTYDVFLIEHDDAVPKPRNFTVWSTWDEAQADFEKKKGEAYSRLRLFDREAEK